MIAELGHYALVLALALALIQSVVPLIGARTRDPVLMQVAAPTAMAQFLFVATAFGATLGRWTFRPSAPGALWTISGASLPV